MKKYIFFVTGILLPALTLLGQTHVTITGQILASDTRQPLPNISVQSIQSKTVTTTNTEGQFTIQILHSKDSLLFTHVGYKDKKIAVFVGNHITILVEPKTDVLSSVTITSGYQKVSKERMVGAFSQLDSARYARKAGMGIIARLEDMVSGISFTPNSDPPIQVRGISTIPGILGNTAAPLVIVDNFPYSGDISSLNPNDIQNITMLKDAAAASVWGAKAGNGVIVITTKTGKRNTPLNMSATSNLTVQGKPNVHYFPQMSNEAYIEVERFLFNNGYYAGDLSNTNLYPIVSPVVEILDQQAKLLITEDQANELIGAIGKYDLRAEKLKYLYRHAVSQQHHLQLSGGSQMTAYSVSIGHNRATNNLQKGQNFQQSTFNAQNSIYLTKWLDISAGVNLSLDNDRRVTYSLPNRIAPYSRLADYEGQALAIPYQLRQQYADTAGNGKLLDWNYRPLDEIANNSSAVKSFFTRVNLETNISITPWLKASAKYQGILSLTNNLNQANEQMYATRNTINRFTQINEEEVNRIIPLGSIIRSFNNRSESNYYRTQLNVDKRWNTIHEFTGFIATDISQETGRTYSNILYGYNPVYTSYATGLNYAAYYPQYGQPSQARIPDGSGITEGITNKFISVIGSASYTYNSRYTFYGSARRDGSNVFGVKTNNRWKPLWSAGVSWEVSKEQFYKISWLPYARLRMSYGYTGNVNNRLSGLATMFYNGITDYTSLPWALLDDAPNPDLRWEQVATTNMAIDFRSANSSVSGSLDFFIKKSTDIIAPIPFDPTTGVRMYTVNSASLSGKGFELSLLTINTKGAVGWETSWGYSHTKTIVTEIYNSNYRAIDFIAGGVNAAAGRLAYGLSSFRWGGLDGHTGDPLGYLGKSQSKDYAGIYNDSLENQVFHGSSIPLHYGFILNTFRWKNLSLSFNIAFKLGYYFREPVNSYSDIFDGWQSGLDYESRWQKPGDELHTNIPSMVLPTSNYRDILYKYASVHVRRGDHIRWKDIRLNYMFKRNDTSWRAQCFVYANNINQIIWRKQKSVYDPESVHQIPTPSSITAGVNLTF